MVVKGIERGKTPVAGSHLAQLHVAHRIAQQLSLRGLFHERREIVGPEEEPRRPFHGVRVKGLTWN